MTLFTTSKRSSAYWVSFDLAAGAADAGRSPSCLEQDGSVYAAEERLSSPSFPGKMTLVSKCNGSHAAVDANCVEKVGHLFSYEGDLFDFFSSQWAKRLWRKGFSSLDLSSNATMCQPLIAVFPTLVHQYRGNNRHRIFVVPARWKTLWRSRTLISSESRQPPDPAGWIIVTTVTSRKQWFARRIIPFLSFFQVSELSHFTQNQAWYWAGPKWSSWKLWWRFAWHWGIHHASKRFGFCDHCLGCSAGDVLFLCLGQCMTCHVLAQIASLTTADPIDTTVFCSHYIF